MEVRRAHWAGPGLHALIGGSSWPCEATKLCFAPTSRPSTFFSVTGQDVDARDKPGHDGGASTARTGDPGYRFAHPGYVSATKDSGMNKFAVMAVRGDEAL